MASQEQNLQDLTNAAKKKLEAQKKQSQPDAPQPVEDIYAEFREDDTYPTIEKAPLLNEYEEEEYEEQASFDGDFQLYEDGPYKSQIDIWKKQYGEGRVLHTQILEKHFIFRTLNRFEYKQLIAKDNVDALMREELICANCVLHPRNYNFKMMAVQEGGFPSTLAQIILENSGFTKEYGIEIL